MSKNKYTAPSMEVVYSDSASARCSVGAVAMFGVGAVYWAGLAAVYAAIVTDDVIFVT